MADLQRLFELADPRIRAIWDEKQTQLSTRLEYGKLGLTDKDAEILDTKLENFTGLGLAQQTGEQEPYDEAMVEHKAEAAEYERNKKNNVYLVEAIQCLDKCRAILKRQILAGLVTREDSGKESGSTR